MIVQRSNEEAAAVASSAFGSVITRAYQMSAPNQSRASMFMARSFDFATSVSSPTSLSIINNKNSTMNSAKDEHLDSTNVPRLPVTIIPDQLEIGARIIVGHICPKWAKETLKFKVFTDGITNRLIGVCQMNNPADMILIRVYGEKTDLFIDRAKEVRNMKIMHNAGLSAPVYCTFVNGIAYGFSPGDVLDQQMVQDDVISKLIAKKMAKMHTLQVNNNIGIENVISNNHFDEKRTTCLFQGIHKFLDLLSDDENLRLEKFTGS